MNNKPCFHDIVSDIYAADTRYQPEAYHFVREGLEFTLKSLKRGAQGANRHVTGQELLLGLRDYALREYGPMAKALLEEWGIGSCDDFGQAVFNLVSKGVLGKTDTDSPEDFKAGFDFQEAFVKPFLPQKPPRAPRKKAATGKRPAGTRALKTNPAAPLRPTGSAMPSNAPSPAPEDYKG